MNEKMKLRSGSKIGGHVGGGGGGSSKEEMSPNPQQSASALNSADVREMKEQLDVIIGLVKDWLAKDQEKKLSAVEQRAKERQAFEHRVKLIQMMKEQNLEFVGICDPVKADDWIVGMEKHFSLFGTTDEDKVAIAAFMLSKGAYYWWESAQSSHPETAGPITWATFKSAFYDRYSPTSLRWMKQNEFIRLKQGDRTVQEYEQEFSRLARFAPELVKNDYERAWWFAQGLRPEIRSKLDTVDPETLLEAWNISEGEKDEVQAPNKRRKRKRRRYNNSHFGGRHNSRMPQM